VEGSALSCDLFQHGESTLPEIQAQTVKPNLKPSPPPGAKDGEHKES